MRPTLSLVAAAVLSLAGLATPAGAKEAAKAIKVVMLGDSVTLSGGAPDGQKLPQQVEKTLNEEFKGRIAWTVVNAGIGGETAEQGGKRVKALLDKENPQFILISYGLNDCRFKDPAKVGKDLVDLLAAVEAHPSRAQPFLLTASPFIDEQHAWGKDPFFVERGGLDAFLDRQINRLTRRLACDKDLPMCDVHRAFLLGKDWQKGMLPDGVHPNPEGNRFMGETIGRCFAAYVRATVEKDSKVKKAEKSARDLITSVRKQAESDSAEKTRKAADTAVKALEKCPYLAEAALIAAGQAGKAEGDGKRLGTGKPAR